MNTPRTTRLTSAPQSESDTIRMVSLITSMPSAHSIGDDEVVRLIRESNTLASTHCPRIRFIYLPDDYAPFAVDQYHEHLVVAEVLLNRTFQAQSVGIRPIQTKLSTQHHRQVFRRPPRSHFKTPLPEYRRWYTQYGSARIRPLTQEELAIELIRLDGFTVEGASLAAKNMTWALTQSEQDWLMERAEIDANHRPLFRDEFDNLAKTIENIVLAHFNHVRYERIAVANREIAKLTASVLGTLFDTYTPTPFVVPILAEAYASAHDAHLSHIAFDAGPKPNVGSSLFLAKRQKLRAVIAHHEQQLGTKRPSGALRLEL